MKAKLPNGVVMQFPAGTKQEDVDALVQDFIRNKDVNVKRYLLNNEAVEVMIKLGNALAPAVEKMNEMLVETQKRQEEMIAQFNTAVGILSKSFDKDNAIDKLKKSVDVLANMGESNTKKIVSGLDRLGSNLQKPIKFKYDDSGNITEAN